MSGRRNLAWIVRCLYALTVLGTVVRNSASSQDPILIGLDPWHQHVVVGTQDPAAKQAALLSHTHDGVHAHLQSPVSRTVAREQALVVSIVDNVRAFLSLLSSSASEALLAPQHWVLALTVSMALALWTTSVAPGAVLPLPPPTPPPRTAH